MKSLSDILVVSLEQAVAAPYCSRLLAEAGARVIKLERPGGDFARHYDTIVNGESAYFVWLNSGKQSLEIDLKDDDQKALLERLLAKADVFIQNIRPGGQPVEIGIHVVKSQIEKTGRDLSVEFRKLENSCR